MTRRLITKFYGDVTTASHDGGHIVLLDAKPLKTPGGLQLLLPTPGLACAIAHEWQEQGARVDVASMPLTGLAYVAAEGVPRDRGKIIEHILGFGRSDLVCYRAESPPELARKQGETWDPLLEWLAGTHDIPLQAGEGIAYVDQPVESLLQLEKTVCALDDFQLAGLDRIAAIAGSFVIAFAVLKGRLAARDAFAAAHVDELFQAGKWGRDPPAEMRREQIQAEMQAAGEFLKLSAAAKT